MLTVYHVDFGTGFPFYRYSGRYINSFVVCSIYVKSKGCKNQLKTLHGQMRNIIPNQLHGNYQSLLDEYNKFSSSVDYYEKQAVPEADLIIEQATRSYKAGALDYLDYVLTLNRALAIRQNYLDALNNCQSDNYFN